MRGGAGPGGHKGVHLQHRHNGNGICNSSSSDSISSPSALYHFLQAFMTEFVVEEKNNVSF